MYLFDKLNFQNNINKQRYRNKDFILTKPFITRSEWTIYINSKIEPYSNIDSLINKNNICYNLSYLTIKRSQDVYERKLKCK